MRIANVVGIVVVATLLTPIHASSRTSKDVNKEGSALLLRSVSQFNASFVLSHEMRRDKTCANFKAIPVISIDDFIDLLDPPNQEERTKLKADMHQMLLTMIDAKNHHGKRTAEEMYLIQKEAIEKTLRLGGTSSSQQLCDALAQGINNMLNKSKETMKTVKKLEKEMRALEAKGN